MEGLKPNTPVSYDYWRRKLSLKGNENTHKGLLVRPSARKMPNGQIGFKGRVFVPARSAEIMT